MFTKCMTLGKVNLFDRCELQVKNGTIFPSMDSDTNFSSSLSSFFYPMLQDFIRAIAVHFYLLNLYATLLR